MKRKFGLFLSMLLLAISPYSFQSNNIITKNLNVLSSVYAAPMYAPTDPVSPGSAWTYGDFIYNNNWVRGLSPEGEAKLVAQDGYIEFPNINPLNGTTITEVYGSAYSFRDAKKVKLPDNLETIATSFLSDSDIKEFTVPGRVSSIRYNAFDNRFDTKKIEKLEFDNSNPSGSLEIGEWAFNANAIEGDMVLPEKADFKIKNYAFYGNQIKNLTLPSNPIEFGYVSFARNKIENVYNFNPKVSSDSDERGIFSENEIKNISFDKTSSDITKIFEKMLEYNQLKSLEIPSRIVTIEEDALKENKGWYNDNKKVALYIKDNGQYYLNNDTIDDSNAQDYTINPVLVNFQIQDKDTLPQEIKDKTELNIKRIRSNSDDKDITARITEDYENFKLGDKLELTSDVEGYKLSLLDDSNQITLDPNNTDIVQDTSYGDGYEVGYKKADIKVKYQALPVELKIELVKLVNGAEQAITSAPNVTVKVDGAEQTVTQGTTLNAKYADEVEITPTNNTSYTVDKVEGADKDNDIYKISLKGTNVNQAQDKYTKTIKIIYKEVVQGGSGETDGGGGTTPVNPTTPTNPANPTTPTNPATPNTPNNTTNTGTSETTPVNPTVPGSQVNPTTPTIANEERTTTPTYQIDELPDPNSPNAPDRIVVSDEDGVPLGTYTKRINPDGTFEYVDEDGVPLGATKLVKTGDEFPQMPLTIASILSGLGLILIKRKRR